MTEEWDPRVVRKLGTMKSYVSIVPLWFRIVLIGGGLAAALYFAFDDRQPYRAIADTLGSIKLGFLITWLGLLAPTLAVVYGLAAYLHRRRRKQDFPTATVVRK